MGLYINDKKKFLELCEDFYDNGNLFFVLGYDKDGNLKSDVNTNASETTLGRLLFDASRNKLFGCALNRYEDMERDNAAKEWGKFNGVIIPESSLVNWEQRRYEIAKEVLPIMVNLFYTNNEGFCGCYEDRVINPDGRPETFAAAESVDYADALIEQLKKASNED